MKQELIDFLAWFAGNETLSNINDLENIVDTYLSINDNVPTESRSINENEDEKEFCPVYDNIFCVRWHEIQGCDNCDMQCPGKMISSVRLRHFR